MKISQGSALMAAMAIILAAMLALTVHAYQIQYEDLMLVVPYEYGISSYDVKGIDKISEENLTVTYEVRKRAAAQAGSSGRCPVIRIGTNSAYCEIMGLQVTEGSFFMAEAEKTGARYAVLSETAASQLFGSYHIIGSVVELDGESYLITGIVKDEMKKEAAVYVPSATTQDPVQVLMVKTREGGNTVQAGLMPLGVNGSNSKIIDLFEIASSFRQQLLVSIYLGLALIMISITYRRLYRIHGCYVKINARRQTMYLAEMVRVSRRDLAGIAGECVVIAAGTGILLFVCRRILESVLGWREVLKQYQYLSDYFFPAKVKWLVRCFYCGPVLFICFMVLLVAVLLCRNGYRHRNSGY